MIGGSLMILGWILYHFFGIVFAESFKFVILGIAFIMMAFIIEHKSWEKEIQK